MSFVNVPHNDPKSNMKPVKNLESTILKDKSNAQKFMSQLKFNNYSIKNTFSKQIHSQKDSKNIGKVSKSNNNEENLLIQSNSVD